jgi:hypothetical protein
MSRQRGRAGEGPQGETPGPEPQLFPPSLPSPPCLVLPPSFFQRCPKTAALQLFLQCPPATINHLPGAAPRPRPPPLGFCPVSARSCARRSVPAASWARKSPLASVWPSTVPRTARSRDSSSARTASLSAPPAGREGKGSKCRQFTGREWSKDSSPARHCAAARAACGQGRRGSAREGVPPRIPAAGEGSKKELQRKGRTWPSLQNWSLLLYS